MIQFNLLPDVKLEYVRAQRTKHTVISVAVISAASAFVIFLLLFLIVNLVQKKSLNDLNADIKQYNGQLAAIPDLPKVLTIQSQLSSLTGLHAAKPAATRSFTYIQQITPKDVAISDMTIDFEASSVTITGQTSDLEKVNIFVDTLKFTNFNSDGGSNKKAFSDVVLAQFTKSLTGSTYSITASFDPVIFDNTVKISLVVPNTVSTRSVVEQPQDIFKKQSTTPAGN